MLLSSNLHSCSPAFGKSRASNPHRLQARQRANASSAAATGDSPPTWLLSL